MFGEFQMVEEKIYTCKSKTALFGSIALFLLGAFWFVQSIVIVVNKGSFDTVNYMWIFKETFLLYFCFVSLHAVPRMVVIRDDETVRITFLLGNSITVKKERFKLTRTKKSGSRWIASMNLRGRIVFFSFDTYPELEEYLVG